MNCTCQPTNNICESGCLNHDPQAFVAKLSELIEEYIEECDNFTTNEGQNVALEPDLAGFAQWLKDYR